MLLRVCRPMTVWHGLLSAAMGVTFLAAVIFLPGWFQIAALDYPAALILSPLLLLTLPIDRAFLRTFTVLEGWKRKLVGLFRKTKPEAVENDKNVA